MVDTPSNAYLSGISVSTPLMLGQSGEIVPYDAQLGDPISNESHSSSTHSPMSDLFDNDLPFLSPNDPSTYAAIPPTLGENDFTVDSNGFSSSGSRLGSYDWSGWDSSAQGAINTADVSTGSSTESSEITNQPPEPVAVLSSAPTPVPPAVSAPTPYTSAPSSSSSSTMKIETSEQSANGRATRASPAIRRHPEGVMSLELEHTLLNRLQWYPAVCKLRDINGKPVIREMPVNLADSVAFVDGRRRTDGAAYDSKETGISVTAVATCASTGRRLEKCKKCREKDKSLRKRKRKRDEEVLWSDQDEENNGKLVQLYSAGTEKFDEDGNLAIRFRIGCCVGVTKQHHLNHVNTNNETNIDALEIHRSCDGIILTVLITIDPKLTPQPSTTLTSYQISATHQTPVRILGKVTETERLKLAQKDEEEEHSTSEEDAGSSEETANHHHHHHSHSHAEHNTNSMNVTETPAPQLRRGATPSTFGAPTIQGIHVHGIEDIHVDPDAYYNGESTMKRVLRSGTVVDEQQHILPAGAAGLPQYASQVPSNPTWSPRGKPTTDIEEIALALGSRRQTKGCSSCAARGDRELFSTISPMKLSPSLILNHFRTKYRAVFERVFAAPILQDMTRDTSRFFAEPPFEAFGHSSPAMLQVDTVLAVGACISGYMDSAEKFWAHAIQLSQELISRRITGAKDITLLADGLNRISYYFGSGGDAARGAYYNSQAVKCLQLLAGSGHSDRIYSLPVYETALWSSVTYNLDRQTLDQAHAWAIGQKNHDMHCYTLFLKVVSSCIPDLQQFIATACRLEQPGSANVGKGVPKRSLGALHPYSPAAMGIGEDANGSGNGSLFQATPLMGGNVSSNQAQAESALASLTEVYMGAGYASNHAQKYSVLADNGFRAMEAWLKGDRVTAAAHARTAAIQASIIELPNFAALIPTYFACFICCFEAEDYAMQSQRQQQSQQAGSTQAPNATTIESQAFGDYTELCIKAFTRVSHYRWVRILVDYFVHRLNATFGRIVEVHTCPLREGTYDHVVI